MAHTGWFESLVSAAIWLTPLYLLSQVWLASAWEGRWLWVALAPVLGLLSACPIKAVNGGSRSSSLCRWHVHTFSSPYWFALRLLGEEQLKGPA